MNLKLAQISDIHIGPENIKYHGIDVREQFLRVLEDVQKSDVDALVISGDLALDLGEEEAYVWIRQVLEKQSLPYLLMAGNHDSVARMSRIFGLEAYVRDEMLYFKKKLGSYTLYFLDTEPDLLDLKQMRWLREEHGQMDEHTLVFMHHPPCFADHLFMDRKYPLHNMEHVQHVLLGMPKIRHVFCGHYHYAKTIELGNMHVHLCPATQMQICPSSKDFEIGDPRPGWRKIIWDGQNLETEVRYLEMPKN